ncbi:Transcription factor GTE7 [Acorus calamus]|uniref:Transcription factor GTE7 n=1 Tax=Acorus calamus TaxID=4465 RepID=A0AAV9CG01_ACOCL|nr:Transcription factor GTE7 [Acorus calamus]
MKRKRGRKAGYKKAKLKESTVVSDAAPDAVQVETDDENDPQIDTRSPVTESDTQSRTVNTNGSNDTLARQLGHIKVKLKSSKTLDPHCSHSDAHTPSDTDKSNVQMEKMEDSANSLSEMPVGAPQDLQKKPSSIKIKSFGGLGSSDAISSDRHVENSCSLSGIQDMGASIISGNERTVESSVPKIYYKRASKLPRRDPRYNEKELSAALEVIKKIMKMDAAEPFNSPVDPVALGIPDYFDIIKTPMDFGTIRRDLERGHKYMNSEDVFKDVQFIWDNCYRYQALHHALILNYFVVKIFHDTGLGEDSIPSLGGDLQDTDVGKDKDPRVATGKKPINLTFKGTVIGATESTSASGKDVERSSKVKLHPKSKPSKHKRRRHRVDLHKSDCLCAVCVVRRNRREREGNSQTVLSPVLTTDDRSSQELKQEEKSSLANLCGEYASPSLDHPLVVNVDVDRPQSVKPEINANVIIFQRRNKLAEHSLLENGTSDISNQQNEVQEMGMDPGTQADNQSEDVMVQVNEDATEPDVEHKKEDLLEKHQQAKKRYEEFLKQENPMILQMCSYLFPNDPRSVWSGPLSLNRHRLPPRDNPLRAAIASFMKPG